MIVDERTVDVHISWLRGKLSAGGLNAPVIQTVYGAGYRFVSPDEPLGLSRRRVLQAACPDCEESLGRYGSA